MGKKNSGTQTAGSNHRSRRGKGGRGGSRSGKAYRERDRITARDYDGREERPQSAISEEGDNQSSVSTGMSWSISVCDNNLIHMVDEDDELAVQIEVPVAMWVS